MTQPMVWSCWIHSEWLSGGEGGGGRGGRWGEGRGVDQWPLYDPTYGLELLEWLSGGKGGGGRGGRGGEGGEGGGPMASTYGLELLLSGFLVMGR